jgi:cobalt-zinc-cadmium efflux system outer membrane protein
MRTILKRRVRTVCERPHETLITSARLGVLCGSLLLAVACARRPAPAWHPLEPSALAPPLTVERCLEIARADDIREAQWRARLQAAHAGLTTAREIPNPTVSITWEDIGLETASGGSAATHTLLGSYPILFWVTRPWEIASARASERAEQHAVRGEQRQLAIDIGTAYWGLVADERQVEAARALLATVQESQRLTQRDFELGYATGYDVARAEAETLEARGTLEDKENQRRQDQLAFAFALGADRPMWPEVLASAEVTSSVLADPASSEDLPEALIAHALARDPEFARAKAAREAAQAEVKLQFLQAVPLADVQGSAGYKWAPEGDSKTYALEGVIPLFSWNQGGIARARAELASAQADEEKARRAVIQSVATAWQDARLAHHRWSAISRPLAEHRETLVRSARRLYSLGESDYQTVLQVDRDWEKARLDEVDVWRTATVAAWTLDCTLGLHDPPE